ncbi:hypothetical protein AAFF_G00348100 [Aldrovandia affinis]|uniref:Uncharacterized protein n=1 Tax=Aldrovandia affinis TaxID=143900 RepID=A0AAD7VZH2_9TELE|nr:hypothetical protein AAFF_G00348100 [Aldrovandia affinis]
MASNIDSPKAVRWDRQDGWDVCDIDDHSSSGASDFSDDSSDSDKERPPSKHRSRRTQKPVCKYYNKGHCKYGGKCQDLHVCMYFLQGNCRNGKGCPLKHKVNSGSPDSSSDEGRGERRSRRRRSRSSSRERDSGDRRPYAWQIDSGKGWKDIDNDHIIEAQYSRPSAKGIKLYNTRFGAISIDFNRMTIRNKAELRVRRRSSKQADQWVWYYNGNHGWVPFGKKGSKGKAASATSSQIEAAFQSASNGSFRFAVDTVDYKINFREMRQVNLATGQKRRVLRRPRYRGAHDQGSSLASSVRRLAVSSPGRGPTWEFEGDHGKWYVFKKKAESSTVSADIEVEYQRNPQGSMDFTVGGQCYTLDFSAMTQTNRTTGKCRKIQRVRK